MLIVPDCIDQRSKLASVDAGMRAVTLHRLATRETIANRRA